MKELTCIYNQLDLVIADVFFACKTSPCCMLCLIFSLFYSGICFKHKFLQLYGMKIMFIFSTDELMFRMVHKHILLWNRNVVHCTLSYQYINPDLYMAFGFNIQYVNQIFWLTDTVWASVLKLTLITNVPTNTGIYTHHDLTAIMATKASDWLRPF